MKQNLFKSICKGCETTEMIMVKNIGNVWVAATCKKVVPDNLPNEICPTCKEKEAETKRHDLHPIARGERM